MIIAIYVAHYETIFSERIRLIVTGTSIRSGVNLFESVEFFFFMLSQLEFYLTFDSYSNDFVLARSYSFVLKYSINPNQDLDLLAETCIKIKPITSHLSVLLNSAAS